MFRWINDKYLILHQTLSKFFFLSTIFSHDMWISLFWWWWACHQCWGGELSGVFQPLLKQIEFDNNLMQSFSKTSDYTRRDNLMRFILLHIKNFAGRQSRYIYTTNMHGTQGSADLFKPKIKSKNVPLRKNLCFFCSNDNKKGVYAESFFENFWI